MSLRIEIPISPYIAILHYEEVTDLETYPEGRRYLIEMQKNIYVGHTIKEVQEALEDCFDRVGLDHTKGWKVVERALYDTEAHEKRKLEKRQQRMETQKQNTIQDLAIFHKIVH